jgi:hypothetical protein
MNISFSTDNKVALEFFPPIPAKKFLPDWYKKASLHVCELNANMNGATNLSVKGCIPLQDYITNGYIIRAGHDVILTPGTRGDIHTFDWRTPSGSFSIHPHEQCPVNMNEKKNDYIKVISNWSVETPSGYSCYFYQPEYFLEERFRLFPGIVDTDGYNAKNNCDPVHFPGLLTAKETIVIEAGTPLMVVFPFKREKWIANSYFHEPIRYRTVSAFISRGYKKLFHKTKSFD